ncbi:aromatic/alkene monooxygenase hydroxylase subunit beta [Amphritea sp.]|uniref:aromatic/alkene monooxygenase hydroxylase subunit beta n=1 Tax=Amphritea sp. TaxID=1872502 RepID=UPI003A93100C
MTIEIKTAMLEPVRHTFAHIERRFGDKPATRYQEATYDVASERNFHYKPLWQPEYELNDVTRTAIVMQDWYAFKDPRQFYYGSYVQARAKQQEVAESNYSFFEKRDLARLIPEAIQQKVIRLLVPLRHVEQAANLNNMYGNSFASGTAISQALLFNGMDRLGNAQYLSRIGLILDGNSGDALVEAKGFWMSDAVWQGMRAYCEANICVKDWFESFVAQDVVLDGLIYELVYLQFDQWLADNGGQDFSMLTEFIQNWNKETNRWVDAVVKIAAAESTANQQHLELWITAWKEKALKALQPLAQEMIDDQALNVAEGALLKRLNKAGLFQ